MASNRKINFPEELDIHPLTFSNPRWLSKASPDLANSDPSAFDDSAQRLAIQNYGIAGRVWEAAYALSLYVNPSLNADFDPPFTQEIPSQSQRILLELGAGTGMASSRIAETLDPFNDIFIVTDLPEVCPLLETNLLAPRPMNSSRGTSHDRKNVHIRPLTWGNEDHCANIFEEFIAPSPQGLRAMSHVICSDLIYFPELLAPLLRTLIRLTSPPFCNSSVSCDQARVIISYKIRSLSKEARFWSVFGLWFEFQPILVKDATTEGGWQRFSLSPDDTVFIFTAQRRPESLSWSAPSDDQDLLAGRGAQGNNVAKDDDTFEALLFMTLEGP